MLGLESKQAFLVPGF